MNPTKKGYLLMFSSTFFGALMYLVSDAIFRYFPDSTPMNVAFWGGISAFLILGPYFFRSSMSRQKLKQCISQDGKILVFISFITSIAAFIWWYTLEQTSSGIIALVGKSEVIFAFLLGMIFLKERFSRKEGIGILVALVGLGFISSLEGEITFSLFWLMLLCRFLYALQSFLIKKFTQNIDGFSFGYLRILFMTIFMGTGFGIMEKLSWVSFPVFVLAGVAIALNAGLCKMLYFEAHKYLDMSKLNFFLILQPVFVLLGGWILWKDPVSVQKIVGTILVLGGLFYFSLQKSTYISSKVDSSTRV